MGRLQWADGRKWPSSWPPWEGPKGTPGGWQPRGRSELGGSGGHALEAQFRWSRLLIVIEFYRVTAESWPQNSCTSFPGFPVSSLSCAWRSWVVAASRVSFAPPVCGSVPLIYHSLSALWCLAAEPAMPLWVRTPNNWSLLKFCLKSKWTVTVYSGWDSWASWHLFWLLGSLLCSLYFLFQFSNKWGYRTADSG